MYRKGNTMLQLSNMNNSNNNTNNVIEQSKINSGKFQHFSDDEDEFESSIKLKQKELVNSDAIHLFEKKLDIFIKNQQQQINWYKAIHVWVILGVIFLLIIAISLAYIAISFMIVKQDVYNNINIQQVGSNLGSMMADPVGYTMGTNSKINLQNIASLSSIFLSDSATEWNATETRKMIHHFVVVVNNTINAADGAVTDFTLFEPQAFTILNNFIAVINRFSQSMSFFSNGGAGTNTNTNTNTNTGN